MKYPPRRHISSNPGGHAQVSAAGNNLKTQVSAARFPWHQKIILRTSGSRPRRKTKPFLKEMYLSILTGRNRMLDMIRDAIVEKDRSDVWNKPFVRVSNLVRNRRRERTNTNEARSIVDPYCPRFIVDRLLDGEIFRDVFADQYADC